MIKINIIIIFLFTYINCLHSQTIYKIEKNNLYGYEDNSNNKIVNCKYLFVFTDTINYIGFVVNKKKNIVCINNKGEELFLVYKYDNGPDYPQEGYFRIISKKGLIGFADTLGNITIRPKYKFAYPFKKGKAKVTDRGQNKEVFGSNGENHFWESDDWFYIDKKGNKINH